MTTPFTSLPIVDLSTLTSDRATEADLINLSSELYRAFSTVGFAYLTNVPLSFGHDDVFGIAKDFFALPEETKMKVAKKTFWRPNRNTYRGYFPVQPGADSQNLKAGFEMGPSHRLPPSSKPSSSPFILTESNCFPPSSQFKSRQRLQSLYAELSSLANTLLALLATSLGKNPAAFTSILRNSISTLRLLHYPSTADQINNEEAQNPMDQGQEDESEQPRLSCTPHTDSGLLTLLHQDATGGLEVRNANGDWIPAPYVPGSLVVNVGDLLAQMSGGRLVATMHRVRSVDSERFSVPFFFEPGVEAMVGEKGREVRYEEFVLEKMGTWVEFQDPMEEAESMSAHSTMSTHSTISAGSSVVVF